uniref:Uncharacterized protein n=1 Tax=Ursus maritimus TaxID=29073 RepID=A0A452UNR8_URSMA
MFCSFLEAVRELLHGNQRKRWKLLQTVELQISLKNFSPQKDIGFSGTIRLQSGHFVLFCLTDPFAPISLTEGNSLSRSCRALSRGAYSFFPGLSLDPMPRLSDV